VLFYQDKSRNALRYSPALLFAFLLTGNTPVTFAPIAQPNDNRTPAGTASDSGITLNLDARRVMWHPNGDSLRGRSTEAFAETGKEPTVPGPLVRVRAGTQVRFRVNNTEIPDTLQFLLAPSLMRGVDTLKVPPGGTGEMRVTLSEPGNYFYRAQANDVQGEAFGMKGLLAGAIIVDSAAGTPRADRVLVVNWLVDSLTPDGRAPNFPRSVFSINGRSWPHTERFSATVGDSIRWRIINLNTDVHPMHLHGVYFRVDEFLGPPAAMTQAGAPGRLAVTERMTAFTTMTITWSPERAGNWLLHCHFALHLLPAEILEKNSPAALVPSPGGHDAHVNHAMTGMSGLVMGIHVQPKPGQAFTDADPPRRRLRLVAFSDSGFPDTAPSLRFRLEEVKPGGSTKEARIGFSPTIELTRGEPVSIMVVNTMREPTAVHWHGIELESYYDGVAGFGGHGRRISPMVAPRDSFEARFTPPRSGTFIYHSHINEVRQHAAGLVGSLIVRDPGASVANDHVFLVKALRANPGENQLEVNGQANPDTVVIAAGVATRFRFISLAAFHPNAAFALTARRDSAALMPAAADTLVVRWQFVAKDGADLPASQRVTKRARQVVGMGETYDYLYTPTAPGDLRIEIRAGQTLLARVPVVVR
jgi:FtsP/CotA-like multicopper oxidase with cupredoxin domain